MQSSNARAIVGRPVRKVSWAAGTALIEEGRFTTVETSVDCHNETPRVVECRDGAIELHCPVHRVSPGFLDVHIHGSGGFDVMEAADDPMVFHRLGRWLVAHGVTSYLATTVSAPLERISGILAAWLEYARVCAQEEPVVAAKCLGIHLEGPYLNPHRAGAHDTAHVRQPADGSWRELLSAPGCEAVRMITVAPELSGAGELVSACTRSGVVVAAGHTEASWQEVSEAKKQGLRHVTHLFNAMVAMHHRRPGIIGAGLLMDDLYAELICDGLHVAPELVRLYHRAKPARRRVLISDAIVAAGESAGFYKLGSLTVEVGPNGARLSDGTLAGSTLSLDQAVRNYVQFGEASPAEALLAVTSNPSTLLGECSRGSIEPGKSADLVVLDQQLGVSATVISGQLAYLDQGAGWEPVG